jgi:small subunit ribosomal protein S4
MGDPKFARSKYDTPSHPWKRARIEEEHAIRTNHGLKNMKEIWKSKSALRKIRNQTMKLIGRVDTNEPHWGREKDALLASLYSRGLIAEGSTIDDVLSLTVDDILARRLQALVYMNGLAITPKQARQLVTHGHIAIGEQKVTIPSYPVSRAEEELITYVGRSVVANENHSIRQDIEGVRSSAEYSEEEPAEMSEVFTADDATVVSEAADDAPSAEDTIPSGGEQ